MPKSAAVKAKRRPEAKSRPVKKTAPAKAKAASQATTGKAWGQKRAKPGDLPVWDLSHLYPGPNSPALKSDLAKARDEAKAFETRFAGKLAGLPGKIFGIAFGVYETIQ